MKKRIMSFVAIIALAIPAANAQLSKKATKKTSSTKTTSKKSTTSSTSNSGSSGGIGSGSGIGSAISGLLGGGGSSSGSGILGNGLSNTDIVSGLKEALTIGAKNAGSRLNVTNGFFGNALIKILMPPEVANAEKVLRQWGMGSLVDDAILSMNRAAEQAAGKAAPIFISAVTSMDINDGLSILRGGNGAATNFLKTKTTTALTAAFRPVINDALGQTGATQLWTNVFQTYNQLPIVVNKINPDLAGYVTDKALSGLFLTIADEENKIRTNPAAQVTSILQKVFGSR